MTHPAKASATATMMLLLVDSVASFSVRAVWVIAFVAALAMGGDVEATAASSQKVTGGCGDGAAGTVARATTEGGGECTASRTAIVVGAGPAGLVSALGLASIDGIGRVDVLEKHDGFETAPRGGTMGISPNGIKALKEISPDLWSDLEKILVQLPPHMAGGGTFMSWFDMKMAMAREVQRHPGIVLHMGESVSNIVDDPNEDGVKVKCESGKELRGDFVVATDGVHSTVRAWLGLPPGIESDTVLFRGSATVDSNATPELQALLHKGPAPLGRQLKGAYFLAFNFHPLHPGRIAWLVTTPLEVDEQTTPLSILIRAGLDEDDVPLFRELFEKSPPDSQLPTPRSRIMPFDDDVLAQYPDGGWGGRGRVTLVGDAAHGMRPTDGQGGNQAFEDAVILTRTLRETLASCSATGGGDPPPSSLAEALRAFESERLPRVKRIYESQRDRYERRMRGETVGPLSPEFQEWLHKGV